VPSMDSFVWLLEPQMALPATEAGLSVLLVGFAEFGKTSMVCCYRLKSSPYSLFVSSGTASRACLITFDT